MGTIFTSMNMSLCFAAQVLLHHDVPTLLSLIGAGMLLLGVALMALARSLYSAAAAPMPPQVDTSGQHSEVDKRITKTDPTLTGADEEAEDNESLASFIASEFSGLSPSSLRGGSTARQRRS